MKRNDWIGAGTSLGVHLVLLLLFALLTTRPEPVQPVGFIEVDFGPVADGRPVQRAEVERPVVKDPAPQPEPRPPSKPRAAPRQAKPVELPKARPVQDRDKVQTPKTEQVDPKTPAPATDTRKPEPQPEPTPAKSETGGAREGTTGSQSGQEGAGQEERRASPFSIEGLNRVARSAPLPRYVDKVNATVRVRITVDPTGRVVERVILRKGTPALDQEVLATLQRWRFNALPSNAPQETQSGIVTFRFRLE